MATLEKIRSKSVLLVSIIFVALFLFIITIIDNPLGLFIDQTTALNVNGDKIDYERYQERASRLRDQNPQATDTEADATQALIMESLLNREFDKLGIVVTDKELSDILVGENAAPGVVNQFAQLFGTTPDVILSAISNPAANGMNEEQVAQITRIYSDFETDLAEQIRSQKLMNLIAGTINANKLDARALFDEGNTTYTLAAVSRNLFEKPDSVTPSEVEKFYDEHRERYSIREIFGFDEPKRYIRYTTLDITPSGEDRSKAIALGNETVEMIRNSNAMDTLVGNSAFIVNHATANLDDVKKAGINGLEAFLTSAEPGEVQLINNSGRSANPQVVIARLMSRGNKVNGGEVTLVQLDGNVKADSVAALLNSGVKADSIKGVTNVGNPEKIRFAQIGAAGDSLRAAGLNRYISLGGAVAAMTSLDEPEETFDYYTATYDIEPSRATIDALNTRMRDFLINAPRADQFVSDNAMQQGLVVRDAIVGASDYTLDGLDDSRSIIAWAMEAKKGDVSRLYTNSKNTRLTAAAVVDEYDHYLTTSFPGVREGLEAEARMDKTAANRIAEYAGKGKTLAEYQQAMNVATVDTMRGVNFSGGRYGTLAGARGHKPGELVGPLRWNTTVLVYTILDSQEGAMPFDQAAAEAQFRSAAQRGMLNRQNLMQLLLGNGKLENRTLRFTRQD